MPATPDSRFSPVLAFDFGRRRIGVAVGQRITSSATPIGVIAVDDSGPDWLKIETLIDEWQPGHLLVGLPVHADGTDSESSEIAKQFASDLARFDIDVILVDERFSSVEAESIFKSQRQAGLRKRVKKGDIDSISAKVIAERWLATQA
jgi:putative Holliday junction resolvase